MYCFLVFGGFWRSQGGSCLVHFWSNKWLSDEQGTFWDDFQDLGSPGGLKKKEKTASTNDNSFEVDKRLHAMIHSLNASLDHPQNPRFSHQGRIEKYLGGKEVTKLTARGAELLFNPEFELEHGHPHSFVKMLFDAQRRATGEWQPIEDLLYHLCTNCTPL